MNEREFMYVCERERERLWVKKERKKAREWTVDYMHSKCRQPWMGSANDFVVSSEICDCFAENKLKFRSSFRDL